MTLSYGQVHQSWPELLNPEVPAEAPWLRGFEVCPGSLAAFFGLSDVKPETRNSVVLWLLPLPSLLP